MASEVRSKDEVNKTLAELSQQLFPPGLELRYVEVDELREQDVNPRSMPQAMMEQLTRNVQEAGTLESVPLCVQAGGAIQIISGHHRIRAARAAGVKLILVLLYLELAPSRVRAKQLAHNTIAGQDDPELVKRVWSQITDIQARFEAFVDPRIFDDIPKPVRFKPVDVDLQRYAKQVLVLFLSTQASDFQVAVDAIMNKLEVDQIYLASAESYEGWKDALQKVRKDLDIVAVPTAIAEMARLALKALADEKGDTIG
jgi:hypothetical protein